MGMYENVHFGCYIIGDERILESTKTIRICSNDKKHKITDGAFCPECGSEVIKREKLISKSISVCDFDEMVDRFIFPSCDVNNTAGKFLGISNFGAGRRDVEYDIIDFENIEEMVKEMYDSFMKKHEDDIHFLSEYVFDNLEVRFGLFKYYM